MAPDGILIASGGQDSKIILWDAKTGQLQLTLEGHDGPVRSICFAPDSRTLAAAGESSPDAAALWDTTTGREKSRMKNGGPSTAIALAPDGKMLATASLSGVLRIWETATGDELMTLEGDRAGLLSLAFSPDGSALAVGDIHWNIRLWDVATACERATLTGHYFPVSAVTFSPDGTLLASAVWGGSWLKPPEARLWHVASSEPVAVLKGHRGGLTAITFSPDGSTVATASYDHSIKLWDVQR
jgi:WD40 repeat protein